MLTSYSAVAQNAANVDICAAFAACTAVYHRCRGGVLGMYGVSRGSIYLVCSSSHRRHTQTTRPRPCARNLCIHQRTRSDAQSTASWSVLSRPVYVCEAILIGCLTQWTPEARRILTGSTSGEFTLWNGLTFNFETILQAHDSAVRTMQFTHSGAFLASADQSGVIKYFQPNMNNLTQWTGHREAIRGLSFSPDDNRFATASDDSTIRLWSFEEQRAERTLTGQPLHDPTG